MRTGSAERIFCLRILDLGSAAYYFGHHVCDLPPITALKHRAEIGADEELCAEAAWRAYIPVLFRRLLNFPQNLS
jgi:hypothetical protein